MTPAAPAVKWEAEELLIYVNGLLLRTVLSVLSSGMAEGRVVLNNDVSDRVRLCLQHVEDCARQAAAQPEGSPLREDFLNVEKSWLHLARSYEFTKRLTDFSDETKRQSR